MQVAGGCCWVKKQRLLPLRSAATKTPELASVVVFCVCSDETLERWCPSELVILKLLAPGRMLGDFCEEERKPLVISRLGSYRRP